MKQGLKLQPSPAQQIDRRADVQARRCYSTRQILSFLGISKSTFFTWKKSHRLPWLVALDTPVGCAARYRADLVDRFLDGQQVDGGRHFFGSARRSHGRHLRAVGVSAVSPEFGRKGIKQ